MDSDPEKLGYSWEVLRMNQRSLEIQVTFQNPLYVSVQGESEQVEIKINDGTAFISSEGLPLELTSDIEEKS